MTTEKELIGEAKLCIAQGDMEGLLDLEKKGLSYANSEDSSTEWLAFTAATNAQADILSHLIENGVSVHGKACKGALKRVSTQGYTDTAFVLLNAGVTLNLDDQYECLNRAWDHDNYDLLVALLNNFDNGVLTLSMIVSGLSAEKWDGLGLLLKNTSTQISSSAILHDLATHLDQIDVSFEQLTQITAPDDLIDAYRSSERTAKVHNSTRAGVIDLLRDSI